MANLTTEDYENIWLRSKDKLRMLFLSYLAMFSVLAALGAWLLIEKTASAAVNGYIETDRFRTEIVAMYRGNIDELTRRIDDAQKAINIIELDAKALTTIPYAVHENGFSLTAPEGDSIYVEFGHYKGGFGGIKFKSPFTEAPIVVVTPVGRSNPDGPRMSILGVTKSEVAVRPTGYGGVTWIAVGK